MCKTSLNGKTAPYAFALCIECFLEMAQCKGLTSKEIGLGQFFIVLTEPPHYRM